MSPAWACAAPVLGLVPECLELGERPVRGAWRALDGQLVEVEAWLCAPHADELVRALEAARA